MTDTDGNESDFTVLPGFERATDALFDVLSDSRRRFVIVYLHEKSRQLPLRDVAWELASRVRGDESSDVPAADVKAVHLSLYHVHVPKMAETGLVEFDRERNAVRLAEDSGQLTALANVLPVGPS